MDEKSEVIDLIRLADRAGTSGHSVSVRVVGRSMPGSLEFHDALDCEIVIITEAVNGTLDVTLLPEDLEDWEAALVKLEAHQSVSWLNSGRTPNLRIKPEKTGGVWVTVHDGPSSGVTVQVPLFAPSPGWAFQQRDLLDGVRRAYPRKVVETSPGVYEWRRRKD